MDNKLHNEISQFTKEQYSTLFWRVYGWMSSICETELDLAVEIAMKQVKDMAPIKTCATCQIFLLKDDPDVTCMDECVGQTGCSFWTKQYTKEQIERYTKRR